MKKCLYGLFNQFGKVVDVVSLKTENLRGQAWIVYEDVTSATNALRAMQDFPFFGKEMVSLFQKKEKFPSPPPPAAEKYNLCFFLTNDSLINFGIFLLQRVQYAKTKSDTASKIDGTWHRDKRTRKTTLSVAPAENNNTTSSKEGEGSLSRH
jgi:hypothetical protein